MGLLDSIFGSGASGTKPRLIVREGVPLLTDFQQTGLLEAVNTARSDVRNRGSSLIKSDPKTDALPLENLSLAGMEQRAMEIAQGGSALEQETQRALLDIISNQGNIGSDDGGFEDFFRTNVQDPLTKGFEDELISVGRRFGGNTLFSSDRAEADARARDDFLENLTSARADLKFRDRENAQARMMAALGQANSLRRPTDELLGFAESARSSRLFDQQNIENMFKTRLFNEGVKDATMNRLLGGLNVRAVENIATGSGGQPGIGPSLIQAGGSILSALAFGGALS